jgi:hypothetical protein
MIWDSERNNCSHYRDEPVLALYLTPTVFVSSQHSLWPAVLNSNSYTDNCLKFSKHRHNFSHLYTTYSAYSAKLHPICASHKMSQVAILKNQKTPKYSYPLELSGGHSHIAAEQHCLNTCALSVTFPVLFPFWVVALPHWLEGLLQGTVLSYNSSQ